jgi:Flp pilus assembly protein TadD
LFKLGRAEESTQALMLASELAPNDWMVFNHLGDALSEIDRPAEAKAAWEQAVSLLKATNDSAEAQKIERKAKKKGGFSI